MSWLELSVHVSRQNAPLVESLLQNEPVLALTLTDDADNPVLEPGVGETPLWPSVCVTALFSGDTPVDSLARILSLVPGVERPQHVSFRKFEDQQWERLWMDRFKPMCFGKGLWIVPTDQDVPAGATHVLKLEPGLAFGTGTHPTTRDCLDAVQLACRARAPERVLDLGTGTGLMALAAARLGCRLNLAVDLNLLAAKTAEKNVRLNRLKNQIAVVRGYAEAFIDCPADMLIANIHFDVMQKLIKANGFKTKKRFILSGLLRSEAKQVRIELERASAKVIKSWTHEGIWHTFYGEILN